MKKIINKESVEQFCEDEYLGYDVSSWLNNGIKRFGEIKVSTKDIVTLDNTDGKIITAEIQLLEK